MGEFYGGEPVDALSLWEQGTDQLPAGPGAVLGATAAGALAHAFPTFTAARQTVELGIDPNTGLALPEGIFGQTLSPEEASAKYKLPGLSFPNPLPDQVAAEIYERRRQDLIRDYTISRGEGFGTGVVSRAAAGLAGGLPGILDPVNIAASFIPAVGPARAAIMAGTAGGRLALGAAQGAIGAAALTPLQYVLSKNDQEDFGITDAMLNIALGGVFGGGLHALTGGAGDGLARAAPEALRRVADAPAPVREDLLREGIAALAEDRPVDVPPPLADAALSFREAPAWEAEPPPGFYEPETTEGLKPYETIPREPQRLADYLKSEGGLRDEGGELAAVDAGRRRPGLVNRNGLDLDTATRKAWEAGYLPDDPQDGGRPDINALLDHLDRDLRGQPVYSSQDYFAAERHQAALDRNAEIDRLASDLGIATHGLDRARFFDEVADRLGQDRAAAEAQQRAQAHEDAFARAEARAAGQHPAAEQFAAGEPRTLEEMEAEHAQLDRQELDRQAAALDPGGEGAGGAEEPEFGPADQGALPPGVEPGRDRAGDRQRLDAPPSARRPDAGRDAIAAEPTLSLEDRTAADLEAENAELAQQIGDWREAQGLERSDAELAALDELTQNAEAEAKGIEAGGSCLIRNL